MQNGLLSILIPFLTKSAKKPEGAGQKTVFVEWGVKKSIFVIFSRFIDILRSFLVTLVYIVCFWGQAIYWKWQFLI